MDLWLFVVAVLLVAMGAGLLGSLTGLGGGVVMVPVLSIFFGVPFVEAVGAGAITAITSSSMTGATYVRDRLTDVRIGMFLEIATVPGALIGAATTVYLAHLNLVSGLMVGLGVVLLLLLPGSIPRRGSGDPLTEARPDARSLRLDLSGYYHDASLGQTVAYHAENTNQASAIMFGAGLVSGMFGIGGGVFKVLALERALKLPMKVATATSNFMIGVTVAAGTSVLLAAGYINPLVVTPVALGTAAGSYFGSRVLPGLRNRTVRLIFLPVIALLAVELILRGIGLP